MEVQHEVLNRLEVSLVTPVPFAKKCEESWEVTDRSSLCNVEYAYGFNILHLMKENAF